MDEMTKKYPVDGVPTSLKDLGYLYVGLDDHWQNCTVLCPNGTVVPSWKPGPERWGPANGPDYNYQNCVNSSGGNVPGSRSIPWYSDGTDPVQGPYGTPQVDTVRFPDLKAMVSKAHGLGLRAGWYMGNYQCAGANNQCALGGKRGNVSLGANCSAWDMDKLVAGSVKALVDYGFDSVKVRFQFRRCHKAALVLTSSRLAVFGLLSLTQVLPLGETSLCGHSWRTSLVSTMYLSVCIQASGCCALTRSSTQYHKSTPTGTHTCSCMLLCISR
eukprot:COSAG02_NODE_2428_length_8885_cov_11.257796_7_plen_272_part_00